MSLWDPCPKGKETVPHSWSWRAFRRFNGDHIYGASLVTYKWLVTASHCTSQSPDDPKQYKIVLGKGFRSLLLIKSVCLMCEAYSREVPFRVNAVHRFTPNFLVWNLTTTNPTDHTLNHL